MQELQAQFDSHHTIPSVLNCGLLLLVLPVLLLLFGSPHLKTPSLRHAPRDLRCSRIAVVGRAAGADAAVDDAVLALALAVGLIVEVVRVGLVRAGSEEGRSWAVLIARAVDADIALLIGAAAKAEQRLVAPRHQPTPARAHDRHREAVDVLHVYVDGRRSPVEAVVAFDLAVHRVQPLADLVEGEAARPLARDDELGRGGEGAGPWVADGVRRDGGLRALDEGVGGVGDAQAGAQFVDDLGGKASAGGGVWTRWSGGRLSGNIERTAECGGQRWGGSDGGLLGNRDRDRLCFGFCVSETSAAKARIEAVS